MSRDCTVEDKTEPTHKTGFMWRLMKLHGPWESKKCMKSFITHIMGLCGESKADRCPSQFKWLEQRAVCVALCLSLWLWGQGGGLSFCARVGACVVWTSHLPLCQRSRSAFLLACPEEQSLKLCMVKHHKWNQTLLQGNISAETKGWESHRKKWRKRTPDRESEWKSPKLGKALHIWKKEASVLRTWQIKEDTVREAKKSQIMQALLSLGHGFLFDRKGNEKSSKDTSHREMRSAFYCKLDKTHLDMVKEEKIDKSMEQH